MSLQKAALATDANKRAMCIMLLEVQLDVKRESLAESPASLTCRMRKFILNGMGLTFTHRMACHRAVMSVMGTVDDTVGVASGGLYTEPRNREDCGGTESAAATLVLEAFAVVL